MTNLYVELTSKFKLNQRVDKDAGYFDQSFASLAKEYANLVFTVLQEQQSKLLQADKMQKITIRASKGSIIEISNIVFDISHLPFRDLAALAAIWLGPKYIAEVRKLLGTILKKKKPKTSQRKPPDQSDNILGLVVNHSYEEIIPLPDVPLDQIEIDANWIHDRIGERAMQHRFEVETDEPVYLDAVDDDEPSPIHLALESTDPETGKADRLISEQGAMKKINLEITSNGIEIRFAADPELFDDQDIYHRNFPAETVAVTYTRLPDGEWDIKATHEMPNGGDARQ